MSETSLVLDLPAVTVRRAVVSEMANNVYLLTNKFTGAQVLIDAADDAGAIAELLLEAASDAAVPTKLGAIATTHQHWDHVRALAEVAVLTGAPTAAGAEDAWGIEKETGVSTDVLLRDGEVLAVDGIVLAAVHLRGHTPGSIAYVLENAEGPDGLDTVIFSGDSLFPGGVGNTGGDPARFASLLDDVEARLFAVYGDGSLVLPGHGDSTTLGAERPALADWRERGW